MSDQNEIIRKQAEEIEELQSELVLVYDRLYEKKKRKEKRNAEPQTEAKEKESFANTVPHPLKLLLWFWFKRDRLTKYVSRTKSERRMRACWHITAHLTYLPMLIGAVGLILGATPQPVHIVVRLTTGLALMFILFLAWLATTELQVRNDSGQAWITAGITSYIFALFIIIPVLYTGPAVRPSWPLVFVGLALMANGGLIEALTSALDKLPERGLRSPFAVAPFLAAAIILLASYFTGIEARSPTDRIADYVLAMVFLVPLLSLLAIIVIAVGSIPFSSSMNWQRTSDETLSATIFRIALQILNLVTWIVLYTGLVAAALFGSSP